MKTSIDWQSMTHDELEDALESGRDEATRRLQSYAKLLGIGGPSAGKRGRPNSNPLAALLGGEDQETETAGANGAAS